jgi:hypothetical protein
MIRAALTMSLAPSTNERAISSAFNRPINPETTPRARKRPAISLIYHLNSRIP